MKIKKSKLKFDKHIPLIFIILLILGFTYLSATQKISTLQETISNLASEKDKNYEELEKISIELEELRKVDQVVRNDQLEKEIENIKKTYDKAVGIYEDLLDLKAKTKDTGELDDLFAKALSQLSLRDFGTAEAKLNELSSKITEEEKEIAASFTIPESIPENNSPPGSGYSRQTVNVSGLGSYLVSLIAGDLGSTRVIVDTASDSDCGNDCPVLPLSSYISRNGAYAGVNGTYFCPAEYPSCAGKTNSFDLLVMNHKKTYFNSDNNVYSSNPAVIFGNDYIRFVSSVSQWGRDTSPNGVISNFPLLVFNSQVVFGGDDDPKKGSKGGRSFVSNKGNTVYIGVVHNATVAESARVLQTLSMENAMNLDNGGSTALWSGGYKIGPGRNLPNVILFIRK